MSKKFRITLLVAIIAAAGAFLLYYRYSGEKTNEFRTTGMVEAVETSIASKIPGRLAAVNFREGEPVKAGDVIANIDPAEHEAALGQAEASLKAAKATLKNGYDAAESARAQVDAAGADVERAKADAERAASVLAQSEKDLDRARQLFDKGVTARSELDNAVTARDTARAGLGAAKAAVSSSGALYVAAKAGLSQSMGRIETLKADVGVAESAVDLAKTRLADTVIKSPVDAVVEYRTLEPGEVVAAGTSILTLMDTAGMWVRLDMDERLVGRVKPGDKAFITLEYMPGKTFEGGVFDIGREGEFAVERDVTRGRQDIRTFRTRVRVDGPDDVLKPGMTVIVTIPLG